MLGQSFHKSADKVRDGCDAHRLFITPARPSAGVVAVAFKRQQRWVGAAMRRFGASLLSQKSQLTAWHRWTNRAGAAIHDHGALHVLGDSAAHPIESCWNTLADLQAVSRIRAMPQSIAGVRAWPSRPIMARSGASDCG